jgi:hypothetical protein
VQHFRHSGSAYLQSVISPSNFVRFSSSIADSLHHSAAELLVDSQEREQRFTLQHQKEPQLDHQTRRARFHCQILCQVRALGAHSSHFSLLVVVFQMQGREWNSP